MSRNIAIRTNASPSTGIGHLARTCRLAAALVKHQLESLFFIDQENTLFRDYLYPFKHTCLYQGNENFQDEESDAHRFMDFAKEYHIEAVVVDDYRFSWVWEKNVERLGCPLIVLDDRDLVHHQCSMIVDAKWTGSSTSERYKDKVPKNCLRLLGTEYLLLDESYTHRGNTSNNQVSKNAMNIMLSLGGGGDITILGSLVKHLLKRAPRDIDFLVRPVIGPFAANRKRLLSLAKSDQRVQPVVHQRSLHDYLNTTTLFVGAAGGTLYEGLSRNIPMLSFALAKNQINQLSHLEALGHYFHLNDFGEESFDKLAELAWAMVSNIKRIQHLYALPKKVEINGMGTERVAKVIDSLIKEEQPQAQLTHYSSSSTKQRNDEADGQGYVFERADDRHINRYLDARNLSANLQNMTETEKVHRLDHYLWWLKTERISFLLKKGDQSLLYIWHLPRTVKGTTVLTGGWFICSDSCTAVDVLHALNRQLELTDKEFPGLPWVAVIRKTNRFVLSLNKRFGFEIMDESYHLFRVAGQCFPSASFENFNYLYR